MSPVPTIASPVEGSKANATQAAAAPRPIAPAAAISALRPATSNAATGERRSGDDDADGEDDLEGSLERHTTIVRRLLR